MIKLGKASFPLLTKYAGPSNGTGKSGVIALAWPMIEAAGQPAGLVSNCLAVQAFCNVVKRLGNCSGSSTLTCLMFAYVPAGP